MSRLYLKTEIKLEKKANFFKAKSGVLLIQEDFLEEEVFREQFAESLTTPLYKYLDEAKRSMAFDYTSRERYLSQLKSGEFCP